MSGLGEYFLAIGRILYYLGAIAAKKVDVVKREILDGAARILGALRVTALVVAGLPLVLTALGMLTHARVYFGLACVVAAGFLFLMTLFSTPLHGLISIALRGRVPGPHRALEGVEEQGFSGRALLAAEFTLQALQGLTLGLCLLSLLLMVVPLDRNYTALVMAAVALMALAIIAKRVPALAGAFRFVSYTFAAGCFVLSLFIALFPGVAESKWTVIQGWVSGAPTLPPARPSQLEGRYFCPADLAVFDSSGRCSTHLLALKPITVTIARVIERKGRGDSVTPVEIRPPCEGPFFESGSAGYAAVFFGRSSGGRLRCYNFPGVDIYSGEALSEPTSELMAEWKRQCEEAQSGGSAYLPQTRLPVEPATGSDECGDLANLLRQAQRDQGNAQLDLRIATCFERQNNRPKALFWYRAALASDPQLSIAQESVNRLEGRP